MGLIQRVRDAAKRAAEKIQETGRRVVEAARQAVQRKRERDEESLYKEETPPDYVSEPEPIAEPEYVPADYEVDVAEVEKVFEEAAEEVESLADKLKREDLEKREAAHQEAYNKFNDAYFDGDLTREQYDNMWNTIGEFSNDHDEYGSPDLILLYEEMYEKYGEGVNDPALFAQLFETAANSIDAMYPSDAIDVIYNMLDRMPTLEDLHVSLQSVFA